MAVNNPVALPLLLTITSIVLASYNWENTPESLPLWWSAHSHPILWVPRWLGVLLFPFLELVIPYVIYQVACRDTNLDAQSGESAYAVANIIVLPAVLVFVEYVLVFIPVFVSSTHTFLPRIFTSNLAIWALCWLGYNLQYVQPNTTVGISVVFPITEKDLWATAHNRAGWVLMGFGVILFVISLACPIGVAYLVVSVVVWLGSYVVAILDSYIMSRTCIISQRPAVVSRAAEEKESATVAVGNSASTSRSLTVPLISEP